MEQLGEEAQKERTRTPMGMRRGRQIGCCLLPVVALFAAMLLFYVWAARPRFFAETVVLQVTQSVCGTWQAVSGSAFGPTVPRLDSLAVVAKDDIWGHSWSDSAVYHWNGSTWSGVALPRPPSGASLDFYDVSTLPGGEVWIVGSYEDVGRNVHALAYHLVDHQWVFGKSVDVEQASTTLSSVSGTTKNDVWAVGSYTLLNKSYAYTAHWNGSTWAQVAAPHECPGDQELSDVIALGTNDVWAVGSCSEGTIGGFYDTVHTLVQHWDGAAWKDIPSPNHLPSRFIDSSSLSTITGTGPNDLWAGGTYWDSDGNGYWTQPMLQHWDGRQWSEITLAHPGIGTTSNLSAVAAFAPDDVWAIGYYSAGELHPVALHWDGKEWSEVQIPNPLAEGYYSTLAPIGSNNLWAMGFGYDHEDGVYYGLSARFEGQPCSLSREGK
jgi:hypothetical protein